MTVLRPQPLPENLPLVADACQATAACQAQYPPPPSRQTWEDARAAERWEWRRMDKERAVKIKEMREREDANAHRQKLAAMVSL